jgi:HEPN domain-containing protein
MNRYDFQKIARIRIREAKVLLDNGFYDGAYYLAGYAVECALKACIAKETKRYDFPEKESAIRMHTHNLRSLLTESKLDSAFQLETSKNKIFEQNWSVTKDWSERYRYSLRSDKKAAEDLYSAITSRTNGILIWLKKHW